MADKFNPYHVWLSIPPDEQPANYYRLLSLRLFETDSEVIDNAADRQTAHLRTVQTGKHRELTQQLLNEVAAARVCLLDPKKRVAYDQQLRAKHSAMQTAMSPGEPPTTNVPATAAPMRPVDPWESLLGDPTAKSVYRPGEGTTRFPRNPPANRRNLMICIAAALVAFAVVGIGHFVMSGPSDGKLAFDWPAHERKDAELIVDGQSQSMTDGADGEAFELTVPPGQHVIRVTRVGFEPFEQVVNLSAGTRQSVRPTWTTRHKKAPAVVASPIRVATTPQAASNLATFDLLAKVDAQRDSSAGHWTRNGAVVVSDGEVSTLTFPTEIPDASYELLLEFSRDQGSDCLVVNFPVASKECSLTLSNREGKYSGVEMIDGKPTDNADNPTSRSPSILENGKRYIARIKVKVQQQTATIHCFLNDDEIVAWQGSLDALSENPFWHLRPHRAGVVNWHSPSTIYRAQLLK